MVSLKGCFVLLAWISIGIVSVLYAAHCDNCRTIELLPRIRDKALKSYVIRTVQVPKEDVCEISCYQESNCVSYNWNPAVQSCDLNNRSHEQVSSDDLVSKYGSVYRSFLNSCHGVTCPVNVSVCQVGFTNKGYRCACREGYVATGDHGQCEDIDECNAGSHDCSPFAICNNVPGSFRCSCNSRFTGDGKTCAATCSPPTSIGYGSWCYLIYTLRSSWENANRTCSNIKGQLLKIESADENEFVKVQYLAGTIADYWIGLINKATESEWVWSDETGLTGYKNWGPGQPDNDANEWRCGGIRMGNYQSLNFDAEWHDDRCNVRKRSICEYHWTVTLD